MYLEEVASEGMDWIHLALDEVQHLALVNVEMNLQIP
jgi:hypothetical protein